MASLTFMWLWMLAWVRVLYYTNCTCLLPEVYKVGVLSLGHASLFPTWRTGWCDDVTLCGRTPMSLRIVTLETTLDKTFKIIDEHPNVDLWLLTTRVGIDSQPVKDYLKAQRLLFLDYSQRQLPKRDADWCDLILKIVSRTDPMDTSLQSVGYVLSVVEHAKLKTVVVVYDNTTEMGVAQLGDGLSLKGILFVMIDMVSLSGQDFGNSINFGLVGSNVVDFQDYTNIVFWCHVSCVSDFLHEVSSVAEDGATSIGLQHMTRILIVHPSIQTHSSSTTDNLSDLIHGDQSVNNVSTSLGECLSQELNNILTVVQQFYHVAVLWKAQNCVRLQTMVLTKNRTRTFSYVGYSYNRTDFVFTSEVFPNTKWRLNGQKFIVATAIWEPFVIAKKKKGKTEYSGLCIDMLRAMAKTLNFTYNLVEPPDGQYGSIENGSWTGLVRMLKDRDAEMVVAPIAVNELRATVVDFSTPFYQDYTGILFKRPDPALHKWKTYFMPFRWQVYVLLGVSFVLGTAFGHVVGVWSVHRLFPKAEAISDIMDTVQYFFGSLLAQGGVWDPTTASARMFVSAWWLFCVVMAAIYSGNLTASFAVSVYEPSFTTIQGMLAEEAYDFGTVPGTIWFDVFKYSNRSDFKRIEQEMIRFAEEHKNERINEIGYHEHRASVTNYAYIGNMGSLSLTVAKECDLMILQETFLPLQYAVALQKGSPLTDTVSRWILQMNEGGLDELWVSHWWRTTDQKCDVSRKTEVKIVNLEDCQSAFYVLPLGLASALIAVFLERVFHWLVCRKSEEDSDKGKLTPDMKLTDSVSSEQTFRTALHSSASPSTVSSHSDGCLTFSDCNGLQETFSRQESFRDENDGVLLF